MRGTLAAQADAQNGLITRVQARLAGYSDQEMRRLLKQGGEWHAVRRGIYADSRVWAGLTLEERHRREVCAVLLNADQHLIGSHSSAAAMQHVGQLRSTLDRIHVLGFDIDGTRAENGVQYHRGPVPRHQITHTPYGLATCLPRSAADVARAYGFRNGLVVADHALRTGHMREELIDVVERMRSWPGVTTARALIDAADGGSANVGETLMRVIVASLGFGRPETQFKVEAGGRTAYIDLRLGLHLFEFDVRQKYTDEALRAAGSVPGDVVFEEKKREDWVRAATQMGMSRVVWDDCLSDAAVARCRGRLMADVKRTIARVGLKAWMDSLA